MSGGRLSMSKKILIFLSYMICMLVSKSSSDAVNSAGSVEELDEIMLKKAGFNGRS